MFTKQFYKDSNYFVWEPMHEASGFSLYAKYNFLYQPKEAFVDFAQKNSRQVFLKLSGYFSFPWSQLFKVLPTSHGGKTIFFLVADSGPIVNSASWECHCWFFFLPPNSLIYIPFDAKLYGDTEYCIKFESWLFNKEMLMGLHELRECQTFSLSECVSWELCQNEKIPSPKKNKNKNVLSLNS